MLKLKFLKGSILLLTLVVMSSCGKEKIVKEATTATTIVSSKERILNFLTLLENVKDNKVSDRTAQNMSVEDLVWNVEATLNYNYSSADVPFKEPKSNVVTYDIPAANTATITPAMADAAYQAARSALTSFYNSITNTVKNVVLVDVYHEVLPSGDVRLYFNSVVGVDNPDYNVNGFNDWWYGLRQGRCQFSQNWDAALELAKEANKRVNNPNYYHYFTDIEFATVPNNLSLLNPNDQTPGDNYHDFLFYRNSSEFANFNSLLCLQPTEMDFYYDGLLQIINILKPVNKSFAIISNPSGDQTLCCPVIAHHLFTIKYGVMHTEPESNNRANL